MINGTEACTSDVLLSYILECLIDLLTACSQLVKQLVALCNVLITADIKTEQRDAFSSPNGMIIIHLLTDLESIFVKI